MKASTFLYLDKYQEQQAQRIYHLEPSYQISLFIIPMHISDWFLISFGSCHIYRLDNETPQA
jgi:hypothetical protein